MSIEQHVVVYSLCSLNTNSAAIVYSCQLCCKRKKIVITSNPKYPDIFKMSTIEQFTARFYRFSLFVLVVGQVAAGGFIPRQAPVATVASVQANTVYASRTNLLTSTTTVYYTPTSFAYAPAASSTNSGLNPINNLPVAPGVSAPAPSVNPVDGLPAALPTLQSVWTSTTKMTSSEVRAPTTPPTSNTESPQLSIDTTPPSSSSHHHFPDLSATPRSSSSTHTTTASTHLPAALPPDDGQGMIGKRPTRVPSSTALPSEITVTLR